MNKTMEIITTITPQKPSHPSREAIRMDSQMMASKIQPPPFVSMELPELELTPTISTEAQLHTQPERDSKCLTQPSWILISKIPSTKCKPQFKMATRCMTPTSKPLSSTPDSSSRMTLSSITPTFLLINSPKPINSLVSLVDSSTLASQDHQS